MPQVLNLFLSSSALLHWTLMFKNFTSLCCSRTSLLGCNESWQVRCLQLLINSVLKFLSNGFDGFIRILFLTQEALILDDWAFIIPINGFRLPPKMYLRGGSKRFESCKQNSMIRKKIACIGTNEPRHKFRANPHKIFG